MLVYWPGSRVIFQSVSGWMEQATVEECLVSLSTDQIRRDLPLRDSNEGMEG